MTALLLATAFLATFLQTESARMRQYLSLAEATLRNPVTPLELRHALLSSAGVAAITSLFERSIEESLVLEGMLVTPELGGEATLNGGRLTLVPYPDPLHTTLREMVELASEPQRLLAFLESSAMGRKLLAETGGLHALLFQMKSGTPSIEQRRLLSKVVASAVASQFKTWSTDPAIQARMIETTDWRGRYVGFWHIHPPRLQGDALAEGIEPSVEDMSNASELGQFLTLVFQAEGFDAYDLSALAGSRSPDLSRARVVRYRSPDWKPRFEGLSRARRSK